MTPRGRRARAGVRRQAVLKRVRLVEMVERRVLAKGIGGVVGVGVLFLLRWGSDGRHFGWWFALKWVGGSGQPEVG